MRSLLILVIVLTLTPVHADEAADRGYEVLTEMPLLTSDFDQEVFDNVWKTWPKPLREKAESATVQERRQMAMERYGLTPHRVATQVTIRASRCSTSLMMPATGR